MAVAANPSLTTIEEWIVAILRDVVEDSVTTIERIEYLFGIQVANAIFALTHAHDEPREKYISRVLKNVIATKVKFADLNHNMSFARLRSLDIVTRDRLAKKYARDMNQMIQGDA